MKCKNIENEIKKNLKLLSFFELDILILKKYFISKF